MLKLEYDGREINIRFSHRILDENSCQTITKFNGERRCTWAQVIFVDGIMEFDGESICHPKDNYCKSTGRKIALADAMKSFSRDLRKNIWEEYHKHCK